MLIGLLPSDHFHELIEVFRGNLSPPEGPEQKRQAADQFLVGLEVSRELSARCGSSVEEAGADFLSLDTPENIG